MAQCLPIRVGFQIFSLEDTRKLDDDGVTFTSIYDGDKIRWTPEDNMDIQQKLGADIIMQLDQCPPYPATREFVQRAVDLSANWARRCLAAHKREDQALFAICQGGMHLDLRLDSIARLKQIGRESVASGHKDFAGFGIGGYSVGEDHETMFETLGDVAVRCRKTSRVTLWALAIPLHWFALCMKALTCSIACCLRARHAWVRRFLLRVV